MNRFDDILLDENFDLLIQDGDIVLGNGAPQSAQLVFLSHKGEFKNHPLLGFGASRWLKKSKIEKDGFLQSLKRHLKLNGFEDFTLDITQGFDNIKIIVNDHENTNL